MPQGIIIDIFLTHLEYVMLPYLNKHTHPEFSSWPCFQRNYSSYEPVIYSVVPFYFHPSVYLSTPEMYNLGATTLSPVAFNQHQTERSCKSYYRYTPAEMNDCKIEVLEKTSTVHSFSGQKAMIRSCGLSSSSSEKSRFSDDAVQLIASNDHSDAKIMEQRKSSAERDYYKSTVLNASHKQGCCEKNEINNISGEFNARTSCSVLSQSSYLSALDLNLTKENMSSPPGEELEPAEKEQKKGSILPKDAAEEDVVILYTDADFAQFNDSEADEYKYSDLDNDSQLEYHSAEEEGCVCHGSSYKQETKTLETFQNKKLANEDKLTGGQQYFNKLENESSNSGSNTFGYYFSKIPELPHVFQDGKCSASNHLSSDDQGRDETIGTFYTVVSEDSFIAEDNKGKNPESFSTSKTVIDEKVIANCLTDTTQTSVTATNRELCKQTDYSHIAVFQKTGNSHLLLEETAFFPPPHTFGGDPEVSANVIVASAKERSTYKSCGRCGKCKENFPNSELKCITYLDNTASKNQSTVNQAVDASSDFRACFTTSRATNVNVPVISRGQNTMITMMSKCRPKEWLTKNYRSVACNTDWSCVSGNVDMIDKEWLTKNYRSVASNTDWSHASGNVDMIDSQIAFENYTAKYGWQLKNKDLLESRNSTSKDFSEIPESMMQLSQEIASHAPNCCKEIWQRAIQAEMQLLKMRYQLHHQHFWQNCNSVTEEKEHLNSSPWTGNLMSLMSWPQNVETSSHPLVTHALNENSCPQLCLSNTNSEERGTSLVENRPSHTQDITEEWFDATENPAVTDSSLSHIETQNTEDSKKTSKNIFCIHVDNLNPLVSEVDLWLCFQKYNVSEISICEYPDNNRYASLSFKTASDAKLAVKEMNEKEIRGKAIKVRHVKIIQENRASNCQKQEFEKQGLHSSSKKDTECGKNGSVVLKVLHSASGDPKVSAGGTLLTSKRPDVSKSSFKSSLPPSASVPRPISASSKSTHCTSAPSKVPTSDNQSSKPVLGNTCFEIDQEDIGEGLLLLGSVQSTPNPSSTFVPPNTLNLRSFSKIVKKLEELHPEFNRDSILNALVEIKENEGLLSGLPLSAIVQMTSSLLNKKFKSKCNEKQGNNLKNK
ncbi:RNA-binding protein 44 isoform X1 [Pogona vitticeps]